MKLLLYFALCMLLLSSCNTQENQQTATQLQAIIDVQEVERDSMSGQIVMIVKKLKELSVQETYLNNVTTLADTTNLYRVIANIDASIDETMENVKAFRANSSSTVNELTMKMADLQRELIKSKAELADFKSRAKSQSGDIKEPLDMDLDLDLYISSLEAELHNTKIKYSAVKKEKREEEKKNNKLEAKIEQIEASKRKTIDSLSTAISAAKHELAKLIRENNENFKKFEAEKLALTSKLEKEKAMVYVNIARSMAREVENVKKSKGKRDEFCQKVVYFYEQVLGCNCDIANKVKTEYENFKRNCD